MFAKGLCTNTTTFDVEETKREWNWFCLSVCKLKKEVKETEDEKFQIILDKQEEVQ